MMVNDNRCNEQLVAGIKNVRVMRLSTRAQSLACAKWPPKVLFVSASKSKDAVEVRIFLLSLKGKFFCKTIRQCRNLSNFFFAV